MILAGHLHQDVEVTAVSRPVDLHSRPVEIPAQRKDGEGEGEKKRKRRKKQSSITLVYYPIADG